MFKLDPPRVWWATMWLGALFSWWSHADWRAALRTGGALPEGSTTLWVGSALINSLSMVSYLIQMISPTLNGPRLRYAELHAVVLVLPAWALLMALAGLALTVLARRTALSQNQPMSLSRSRAKF